MMKQDKDITNLTEEELKEIETVELAYRQAKNEDIPDLWNRIEVSLPEKTPDAKKKKVSFIFNISRAATLIAACLCLFILVPYLLFGNRNHYEATPQSDASKSMEDNGMRMFAAKETEEATTQEALAEEPAQEAPAEEAAEQETVEEETGLEEAPLRKETTADMNGIENEKSMSDEDRTLYTYNLQVEIMNPDVTVSQDEIEGYHCIPVKILEDASGMYQVDSVMNVYITEYDTVNLKEGDRRRVTFCLNDSLSSAQRKIFMTFEKE